MPQPTGITIELECDQCSNDLVGEVEHVRGRTVIRIKPCPTCLTDATNPPGDEGDMPPPLDDPDFEFDDPE